MSDKLTLAEEIEALAECTHGNNGYRPELLAVAARLRELAGEMRKELALVKWGAENVTSVDIVAERVVDELAPRGK